jgi:hypothetical protein
MQTTTRSDRVRQVLATLLLGLVMAAGIWVLAAPEASWVGFALAAMYGHDGTRRSCATRLPGAVRR